MRRRNFEGGEVQEAAEVVALVGREEACHALQAEVGTAIVHGPAVHLRICPEVSHTLTDEQNFRRAQRLV